jgi:hypothetical protein
VTHGTVFGPFYQQNKTKETLVTEKDLSLNEFLEKKNLVKQSRTREMGFDP